MMTEQETVKIVTLIVMSYPASEKFRDENAVKAMVAVWSNIFRDDPFRLVELAVQKHVSINKWPPSIAEIRDIMVDVMHPEIIPPDLAWASVSDLMYANGQYDYGRCASTLPPLVQRAVEVIGWDNLYELHCEGARGGKPGLDRLAFMDQYKPAYEREREKASLPQSILASCEKAEKNLGEPRKVLEAAYRQRKEKEEFFDSLICRDVEMIESSTKPLLGGKHDENQTE